MGDNRYLLSAKTLPDEGLLPQRAVIEQCECIHCHMGDTRMDWTPELFREIVALHIAAGHRLHASCARETFDELSRKDFPLPRPQTVRVEELKSGIIHLHYRNLRLEMTPETFVIFSRTVMEAANLLLPRLRSALVECEEIALSLEKINPFDRSHRPDTDNEMGFCCNTQKETQEHIHGIRLCMELMEKGHKTLPIAVVRAEEADQTYSVRLGDKPYQRLDGFKRYIAHKLSGQVMIQCHLYTGEAAYPGNQRYLPWLIS